MEDVFTGWGRLWPVLKSFIVSSPQGTTAAAVSSEVGHEVGGQHEGLALEGHAVAGDAGGVFQAAVEIAGGGGGGAEGVDLVQAGKLEGLCDDLAAEGLASGL